MNLRCLTITALALLLVTSGLATAQPAEPAALAQSALAKMPVKEVTVFKDGHALVLHEGAMPTDEAGRVQMDYLPTPVIGTFWPYSSDPQVKLTGVVASKRAVRVEHTALDVRGLLEANVGAKVIIKENNVTYFAAIAGVPERTSDELAATSPPNTEPQLPQKGSLILLETEDGTRAVPIERITNVTFRDRPKPAGVTEEFRNLLTLRLNWGDREPEKTANVGMMYLQRGIRWIPSYKLTIDGEGNAKVQLNATLLNEMTDLDDVTANLVIGVPSFAFKETPDPISLQQAFAQLSQYFQENAQTAYALSNSMMTQMSRMREQQVVAQPVGEPLDLGPEVGDGKTEDLFVFAVEHVSLKKGERMVLPVVEFDLTYKDVYTLDLAMVPPADMRRQFDNNQQAELARMIHAPKVMHKIRLSNKSPYPLTTAPALIVRGDRVLSQGMMTYTAVGASTDLAMTTAVDVQVKKTDKETKRTLNAAQWNSSALARIDLAGTIGLRNLRRDAVEIEVTRHVLGSVDEAGQEGDVQQVNLHEEGWQQAGGDYPVWWSWYGWPAWWHHFNGVGRITWKVKLDAGKSVDLGYSWHYFWQ